MEKIIINSIEDFIDKLTFLDETDIFRGQPDVNYNLIPSIGRIPFKNPEKILVQFEKEIFNGFKRKAPLFIDKIPKNEYEWLILAQHYGLPTRLLDWTYNPLVALYFAIENENKTDACIYQGMFSSYITSEQMKNQNPFEVKMSMGVIPTLDNKRYLSQNGLFSIHANPYQEDVKFVINKYIIPLKSKITMRWKLRKLGITRTSIFPQLDSIGYDILQTYNSRYDVYFK
ncbi:FRG domain-containing protein [Marivirga tractuosa]|uniref:FRG domain-containing protein n=1 Tax=Marivirga tractuosa TaxID=1006 RepID=UPI0035D0258E